MKFSELGERLDYFRMALISLGRAGRRGSTAGKRFALCYKLSALQNNLKSAYRYQLPKSTISDHLNDCFGFWFYKRRNRFDKFAAAFCESLLKDMPWLKGMGV